MNTKRTWPIPFILALLPACGDPFAPPPPVVKVKLETLLEEFRANPVGVAEGYRGKHLEFVGYIHRLDRMPFGTLEVIISPVEKGKEFLPPTATIYFSGDVAASLKDYPIGSRITLRVEAPVADSRFRTDAVAVAKKRK